MMIGGDGPMQTIQNPRGDTSGIRGSRLESSRAWFSLLGIRICLLLIFLSFSNFAQKVKWASQVISVSSEYKDALLGKELHN